MDMYLEAPSEHLRQPKQSGADAEALSQGSFETKLGRLMIGDCLQILRALPTDSVDLFITSPPYDGQSKYGNGEKYERDWYEASSWR